MNRSLLAACLLTSLPLAGCLDTQDDAESNLPGDIDNWDGGGGKGDAWDRSNDPSLLANRLNYRLAELPLTGKLDQPVWKDRYPEAVGRAPVAWSDTYWPTVEGSTNHRWLGAGVPSPLEKYDAAYNNAPGCASQPARMCGADAKAEWDAYFACAGPAAKWHMRNFQSLYEQIDGIDNDHDNQIDECDSSDDEGAQGWWGLCHAWTPASLLEPEPQHAVTFGGQTFEVADIKALIVTLYDRTNAVMLGGRCNAETIEHDYAGSANEDCQDVNPGALHVVLTNFLGINDMAIIEDRTASAQVWNQPVVGYTIRKQDEVDATRANECVGASGDKWTFNTSAKKLYEVSLTTDYLYEGSASRQPLGMDGYVGHDTYHYILEVGTSGKIIGGKYCTESVNSHPDFLWAPIAVSSSSYGRNPNVRLDKVRTLINLSIKDQSGNGGGAERSYENNSQTDIPDNDPAGATVAIDVPDSFSFTSLSVSVDIEHSWRGDLVVELLKDGASVATLHDKAGGSADNLTETYTLSPAQVGGDAAHAGWALKVVDTAAYDTGRIDQFKLAFATE